MYISYHQLYNHLPSIRHVFPFQLEYRVSNLLGLFSGEQQQFQEDHEFVECNLVGMVLVQQFEESLEVGSVPGLEVKPRVELFLAECSVFV